MALEREVNLHFDGIDFIRSVFLSLFRSISFDGRKILGRRREGWEGRGLFVSGREILSRDSLVEID